MALIPEPNQDFLEEFFEAEETVETIQPTKTYRLNFATGRIGGMVDGEQSLRQFIEKALLTARDRFLIYDDDYGCDIHDLIGENVTDNFLRAEIPRMIREALIYDERIESVENIEYRKEGDSLFVTFDVTATDGTIVEEEVVVGG